MGDAGSMFMGLTVMWLLVLGSQTQGSQGASFRPITALWIIAVPLMDMLAIMIRRIRKGDSPFKADNGHLHHICMRAGLSSRQALWVISSIAICAALVGIIGEILQVSEWLMLIVFIVLFVMYSYILQHAWKFTRAIK
jgi:UDP-GlcNAc:undecaprenyl-phosphate GlcNAc-1-phosphate transferase